jgi:hypothetical protein
MNAKLHGSGLIYFSSLQNTEEFESFSTHINNFLLLIIAIMNV